MRSDVLREFEKLPARALMMATGLQRKDIEKPLIGIISSWTDLVPGHADMFSLERFIERGVAAAGGTPFIRSGSCHLRRNSDGTRGNAFLSSLKGCLLYTSPSPRD